MVSIKSLETSLSKRIVNVLKESLREDHVSFSLSFPFLSSYLSLPPCLFLESMREREITFERRAGQENREQVLGTHTDTSSTSCTLYIVCDNRYACLPYTAYIHAYIYTYACHCIYRNKPAALQSFNKSGPRLAYFLYTFVTSSVWDGHRGSSTYNTYIFIT